MTKFYAHYELDTGRILSIGGRPVFDDHPDSLVVEIEEEIALKFMRHEIAMHEWFIGMVAGKDKPQLTQNLMEIIPHNLGAMIELPRGNLNVVGIRVMAVLTDDTVEFMVPDSIKGQTIELAEETATFTLTKRNDPTYVAATIEVDIAKLIKEGRVTFDVELTLGDYSMFTNRQFLNYQFETLAVSRHINQKVSNSRFNKMVVYKDGTTEAGIQAEYDPKKKTIELSLKGKVKLTWPSVDRCFLFITKPNDASVVYHALPFNVETFWNEKRVVLPLPTDLDQAFGLASFPLASDLVFTRKSDGNRKKTTN